VTELPIVRHLIACLEVIISPDSRDVTLRGLTNAIVRLPGEPFPCIREELALYAVLTNGRGQHALAVELTFFHRGVEQTVRRSAPRVVDLGRDPSQVLGLPIAMRNLTFHRAGQYVFHLICDGQRIAQEPVEVR
jgi:hypothetical protein